jgi:D-glycero-alpha-D-manno-heptose-7-phosphate kinase
MITSADVFSWEGPYIGTILGKFMAKARAPVRIDLAGGWSDAPPFCQQVGGDVVNIAINHYGHAEVQIDEDGKLSASYSCDVPIGSGLGATGAINVALIAAIKGAEGSEEAAYQFEKILGNHGGRQDQWASRYGGIQHLKFIGEEVERFPLTPGPRFITWLEQHLIIADTGIRHTSGDLHSSVWDRYEQVLPHLMEIRQSGRDMAMAVQQDDRYKVCEAMNAYTEAVGCLDPSLNEPYQLLENIDGIRAWKGMGAAAGGFVGIIARDPDAVKEAIPWDILEWSIDDVGLTVQG